MAYLKDVREHLAALESAGLLVRINREINKDTQLHPLVRLQFRGVAESDRRAFLFTNVTDGHGRRFDIPVAVCHLAGSQAIYALGMQCDPAKITKKWAEAIKNPIDPVSVTNGPVHEEVHLGKELDQPGFGLEEFPLPISTPGFDGAPFVTAGVWITRDPDTGRFNLGNYRGMVKSRNRIGMNAGALQHITQHWRKWQKLGKPMPTAIVMGTQPSISYAAVVKLPYGVDDYGVAGALAGEPVQLVKAKTVDIDVPATAEIVIEGFINTEYLEPEGPFGEYTGYMDPQQLNPFMDVTCITHRKRPILATMLSQLSPSESSKLRYVGGGANVLSHLRGLGFHCVKNAAFNEAGCALGLWCIQVSNPKKGEVGALLDACAEIPRIFQKMVIVVDDDIDPCDLESIVWAMNFRMQPHRDIKIKPIPPPTGDWSVAAPGTGDVGGFKSPEGLQASLMLIDATRKWPYPPVSLPPREIMEDAAAIWRALGLPELQLRHPWHGHDLGWWPEAEKEAGRLALQGRYYETGEKMKQARVSVKGNGGDKSS
ncbi:MAG: UbiD family decarboxylase [Deltaproteobacteria bacterium]|nr:UbiD family decarboxylase [Deltaproteobacteria bacterium]